MPPLHINWATYICSGWLRCRIMFFSDVFVHSCSHLSIYLRELNPRNLLVSKAYMVFVFFDFLTHKYFWASATGQPLWQVLGIQRWGKRGDPCAYSWQSDRGERLSSSCTNGELLRRRGGARWGASQGSTTGKQKGAPVGVASTLPPHADPLLPLAT